MYLEEKVDYTYYLPD